MHHRISSLAILLSLILVPVARGADQGAAKPTTRPAPFENEIRAFEQADRKQPPPQHVNLFVGSSSIRFWTTLASDFPEAKVINRGFGGSQVADSVRYADRIVIPYHPARIFLYAGDNDIAAGKTPKQVLADFEAFVNKVHAALPDTDIYYISIKPSPSRTKHLDADRETNRLIEAYTKDHPHLAYIDVFTPMLDKEGRPRPELFRQDMLHMNRKGYEMWVEKMKPLVR